MANRLTSITREGNQAARGYGGAPDDESWTTHKREGAVRVQTTGSRVLKSSFVVSPSSLHHRHQSLIEPSPLSIIAIKTPVVFSNCHWKERSPTRLAVILSFSPYIGIQSFISVINDWTKTIKSYQSNSRSHGHHAGDREKWFLDHFCLVASLTHQGVLPW